MNTPTHEQKNTQTPACTNIYEHKAQTHPNTNIKKVEYMYTMTVTNVKKTKQCCVSKPSKTN